MMLILWSFHINTFNDKNTNFYPKNGNYYFLFHLAEKFETTHYSKITNWIDLRVDFRFKIIALSMRSNKLNIVGFY
jgi:hypothetical protein